MTDGDRGDSSEPAASSRDPADIGPQRAPESRFLSGPQPRGFELLRALRIFFELLKGFRALHFVGPCVTVFGSARFPESHPYYAQARDAGARLALAGFTVMTGGGPGIMEAANRGAKDAGGRSIGCNIVLPQEQRPNQYLDLVINFRHFYVRKVMLVKYSYAFIAMPGGFGTLDEIFEAATLIQTGKIRRFPIVLIGTEFWKPLVDMMRGTLLREGTIAEGDLSILHVTDSVEDAVAHISDVAMREFGLSDRPKMKRRWFLFE